MGRKKTEEKKTPKAQGMSTELKDKINKMDEEEKNPNYEQEAKDLLDLNVGYIGFQTKFSFVNATLDSEFERSLKLKLDAIPENLCINYVISLIIDPEDFIKELRRNYEEMSKQQLSLYGPAHFVEKMKETHINYKRELENKTSFSFNATLVEMKDKKDKTITLRVTSGIVKEFEKLYRCEMLEDMILVLENS